MTQTFNQRRAIQKYCEMQRSARSQFRSDAKNVYDFKCPPGAPGTPQRMSWVGSYSFLVMMAVIAGVVAGLRIAGVV